MSITTIPANTSGLNMRNLTNSNFADLDGRVTTNTSDIAALGGDVGNLDTEVTTLTGTVNGLSSDVSTLTGQVGTLASDVSVLSGQVSNKARKVFAYPEDFGAVGDGTTDDTAALQACLDSLATPHGVMVLSAVTYKVTATITVSSGVGIWGLGNVVSTIISTQTTGHIISLVGTGPNCAEGSISWCPFRDFQITRTAQATAGNGFNLVNTCYVSFFQVYSFNSINNFYLSGCGNTHLTGVYAGWGTATTEVRAGIFLDSSVHPNQSTIIDGHCVSNGGGVNGVGLRVEGACISDLFVYGFETASMTTGVHIKSTLGSGDTLSTCNSDIHLTKLILDQNLDQGVLIENVNGGGASQIEISSSHFQSIQGIGIEALSCKGLTIHDNEFQCRGGPDGVASIYAANMVDGAISGNTFLACATSNVILDGDSDCVAVNGNVFSSTSVNPAGAYFTAQGNSKRINVVGNVMNGYADIGIQLESGTSSCIAAYNSINPAHISTPVSDTGTSNTVV